MKGRSEGAETCLSVQIKSGQMKERRKCQMWKKEAPDKRGKDKDRDQEEIHQQDQRYRFYVSRAKESGSETEDLMAKRLWRVEQETHREGLKQSSETKGTSFHFSVHTQ